MAFAPPSRRRTPHMNPSRPERGTYAQSAISHERTSRGSGSRDRASQGIPHDRASYGSISHERTSRDSRTQEPLSPNSAQYLREQITLSKIAVDRKNSLRHTLEDLTRDIATLKREENEARRLMEEEQLRSKKRELAQSFRLSNHDATVQAKKQLAEQFHSKSETVRQKREERDILLRRAKQEKDEATKRRSETMKTDMLTHDLRIEKDRAMQVAANAAKAQALREEKERAKSRQRREKSLELTSKRWSHESERQGLCAKGIEDTMWKIQQMHSEKQRLEEQRMRSGRASANTSAIRGSSCESARSSTAAPAKTSKPVRRSCPESAASQERSCKRSSYPAHGTRSCRSTASPASTPTSTPKNPTATSSRQRSLSSDHIREGSTLLESTSSSNAKRTPRCEPTGRVRNRYGMWDAKTSEKSTESRGTIIFTPRTMAKVSSSPEFKDDGQQEVKQLTSAGVVHITVPSKVQTGPMVIELTDPVVQGEEVDDAANDPTINGDEQPDESEVIFFPRNVVMPPQCFVAKDEDTTECLYYETPSLQADAAGQIRQIPLTPVVE